uniref:Non-structural maintenance of chromosomes element 4 n=1 Tax=Melanopsichium pennsylvanicum 4 TaxID=1398559 RepID=A0A077RBA8_9BASI|nr:related to DNA repair protein Rad62 [Melanopsichium pennsylvanicum 4]
MARSTQETHSQAGPSSPPSNPRKRPSTANKEASVSFVYNPRQDADSRRAVRSDYRALIAQAEESKRDSTLKPSDLLLLINKADELHERVVAPSESILDTKTLGNMSEMGARMAKKMKLNQDAFDTHEFMTRLARFLGGQAAPARTHATSGGDNHTNDDGSSDEDESTTRIGRDGTRGLDTWNWSKLGYLAASVSRRAPTMDFILGPLEIVAKQRKIITRTRADECNVEKTAPRALQQQDLQNSAGKESTSQIRQVAKVLAQQGSGGICLFKFAVDPESFVNTIENFFHYHSYKAK